ncbi:hypothetical protein LXL04_021042 [Taraxacum kok-saghyz]
MDGHSYVTKGYSTYTDVPNHEGNYGYGPKPAVNYYVVETTTIERRHGPASTYTRFSDVPSDSELLREYIPKYAQKDHHSVYDPNYESDQEDSSPREYRKGENLVDKFLNKVQIGASHPTKRSNYPSPNKHQHVSPPRSDPFEEGHKIKTQNVLGPNKYQYTSPSPSDNYPSKGNKTKTQNFSAPNRYQPTRHAYEYPPKEKTQDLSTPIMYKPTPQANSYPSEDDHNIRTQDLSGSHMYQPTSPTGSYPLEEGHKKRTEISPIPNKYRQTSPTRSYHSQEGPKIKTQNLPSPNKDQPTSPTWSYPSDEGHKIGTQKFPGSNKYRLASPTRNSHFEEGQRIKPQNWTGPNKHQPTSPMHTYPSKEGELIKTSWGPNKHRPTSMGTEGGRYVRTERFPGLTNNWQSVVPPMTHHLLTTPTNDINEALCFLTQSANYSPHSAPIRAGGFNNFGLVAHPAEPESRYTKPGFVGETTQSYFGSNTIDSHEAMRKYNGALVP